VVLDLGTVQNPCEVELSMGAAAVYYPAVLEVSTSTDGVTWESGFSGPMAGAALRAALENPRDARIAAPLARRPARYLRLRADRAGALDAAAIAAVVVR
jgi:hypothetical protein